jgi:hypothetical protein
MILRKLKNFWGYLQHNSHKQSLNQRINDGINFDANQLQWNEENTLSENLEGMISIMMSFFQDYQVNKHKQKYLM